MTAQQEQRQKTAAKEKRVRVCFVCTGNTCRSPMMKFMFENYLADDGQVTVDSAGVMRHKKPISKEAAEVLDRHSVPHAEHLSRFCDRRTVQSADVIICAEREVKAGGGRGRGVLKKREGGGFWGVASLSDICGADLEDPFGLGADAYEKAYVFICEALPKIYAYITK